MGNKLVVEVKKIGPRFSLKRKRPQPAQGTAVAGGSTRNRIHDTSDVVKTNFPNRANVCVNSIGWIASAHWKLWWTSTESTR
jgi:hypothetical protein